MENSSYTQHKIVLCGYNFICRHPLNTEELKNLRLFLLHLNFSLNSIDHALFLELGFTEPMYLSFNGACNPAHRYIACRDDLIYTAEIFKAGGLYVYIASSYNYGFVQPKIEWQAFCRNYPAYERISTFRVCNLNFVCGYYGENFYYPEDFEVSIISSLVRKVVGKRDNLHSSNIVIEKIRQNIIYSVNMTTDNGLYIEARRFIRDIRGKFAYTTHDVIFKGVCNVF